jgi:hypothetical protein
MVAVPALRSDAGLAPVYSEPASGSAPAYLRPPGA